jgi:hypothetical protein
MKKFILVIFLLSVPLGHVHAQEPETDVRRLHGGFHYCITKSRFPSVACVLGRQSSVVWTDQRHAKRGEYF